MNHIDSEGMALVRLLSEQVRYGVLEMLDLTGGLRVEESRQKYRNCRIGSRPTKE